MASTYSALKIELIGTGDQSGTWGTTTNTNLGDAALGEAITGSADVAFSSADVTVTLTDTNASQTARNLRLNLTGTSGGARSLILGSGCQIEKLYLINNGLADAVTVKNTTGTGIAVPAGKTMFVYNNGTNVVNAVTYVAGTAASGANSDITSLTACTTITGLTTPLSVAQGGTGATTLAAATIATQGYTTTPTAAGTTTLTVSSTQLQFFTGATTQTVVLPVASTLTAGQRFEIHNNSTGSITVNSSGANLVATVPGNTTTVFTCILTSGTTAASWDADVQGFTTSLSVALGGTGNTSATAYAVQCGGTTSTGAHQSIASVGTSGQVLTSNGAGALPTFQAAGGGFATGTRMSFQQTSAPTGWTKDTTSGINDSILRLVTGSVSSGGTTAFSTWNAQTASGATTLSTAQIPSHTHTYTTYGASGSGANTSNTNSGGESRTPTTDSTGSGGSHTHSLTQSIKYYDFIIASKD
jgi:hypothetical protein